MNSILAAPPTGEPRTCPAWCTVHYTDGDLCNATTIELDFRAPGRASWMAAGANVMMAYDPDEGTSIDVVFHGRNVQMTVDDADRIADAIKLQVGLARAADSALIPGPRASRHDSVGSSHRFPRTFGGDTEAGAR